MPKSLVDGRGPRVKRGGLQRLISKTHSRHEQMYKLKDAHIR